MSFTRETKYIFLFFFSTEMEKMIPQRKITWNNCLLGETSFLDGTDYWFRSLSSLCLSHWIPFKDRMKSFTKEGRSTEPNISFMTKRIFHRFSTWWTRWVSRVANGPDWRRKCVWIVGTVIESFETFFLSQAHTELRCFPLCIATSVSLTIRMYW